MKSISSVKEYIRSLVNEALGKLTWEASYSIDYPSSFEHGDYATNVALSLTKILKRAAPDIGQKIISQFPDTKAVFARVEVTGSGFINFFLNPDYVRAAAREMSEPSFGESAFGKKSRVNIEFLSANPTGMITIGNARGAFFGDALGNILRATGYDVTKESYVNDAKTSNQIRELGLTILGRGEAYMSEYLNGKIAQFRKEGFHFDTLDASSVGYMVAHSIQEDIRQFVADTLKIKLDRWFHEQTLFEKEQIVSAFDDLKKRKLIYENDGAIWLKTTQFGDVHDQVLVRSAKAGEAAQPTYFLSDIAYHIDKFNRGYEHIIDVLGADHQGHIKRMEAIARMEGYKGTFALIFTQLVRLKEKGATLRVSKREGTAVSLAWLIEEVGLDGARYFFLSKSVDTHMDFDLELAKTKSLQNPVFYIQYAHARLASILRKAKEKKRELNFKNVALLGEDSELALLKHLLRLPEILIDISHAHHVHALTHYVLTVSTLANSYYEKTRILTDDAALSEARLCLISAAKNVIFKVLQLLGMSAPQSM